MKNQKKTIKKPKKAETLPKKQKKQIFEHPSPGTPGVDCKNIGFFLFVW